MAEFEVPQAAYHAAAALTGESRARLAAAAPHIAAAALRQAAEYLWDRTDGTSQVYSAYLRLRADQLDGRQPKPDTREGILAVVAEPTRTELLALISEALLMLEHGERPDGAPTDPARETWYGWAQRAEAAWRGAQARG